MMFVWLIFFSELYELLIYIYVCVKSELMERDRDRRKLRGTKVDYVDCLGV